MTEIKSLPRAKVIHIANFPCGTKDVAIYVNRYEDDELEDEDFAAIIEFVELMRKAKARARTRRMAAIPSTEECAP